MFFVSEQGNVTTLSQPQTLYAFQFVNWEPGEIIKFFKIVTKLKVSLDFHSHDFSFTLVE